MANIIVIETEDAADLIQDVMKVIEKREDCQYTHLRVGAAEQEREILSFSGLSINLEQYTIIRDGKRISMNGYEFRTLAYLAKSPGRVFTKEQIYNEVYGEEKIVDVDNAIYCLIRDIRKKLKTDRESHQYIQTVRGIGYKFVVPEE